MLHNPEAAEQVPLLSPVGAKNSLNHGNADLTITLVELDSTIGLIKNDPLQALFMKIRENSAESAQFSKWVFIMNTSASKAATRPGGCVIWLRFDPITLALGPYLWFGSAAGEPAPSLGEIVARHTKGDRIGVKALRPNIRVLKQNQFRLLQTIEDVAAILFGLETISPASEHIGGRSVAAF